MSRLDNQDLERYYFELFESHYEVPDGEIVFTDKPDVIVRGSQTLGIEIANLYLADGANDESEQVQRNRRRQLLERSQALHLASGGKHIELSVAFNPKYPILELEPMAISLSAIARSLQDSPSGQANRILFEHVPELSFIYYNHKEYADAKWRPVQVYNVPSLSIDRLRVLVLDKTKKLRQYQPCDIYWLLLIVDFMDPAQDQDLQWPPEELLAQSPFERILLYKPQFRQVVQVPQSRN
jgi:hypothetical protein